ncbi:hypothetical protein B0H17DRAFT_1181919 [Mycena rosella]|uniref:Uncharacterized protein n=1 Tax=Mycena rosella TaxID=1033263 RepID=A0AAD7D8C0_MYCRO|nr:hypothetical protein B0H17DRAFT_1181919 [Mycena rosella]
MPSASAFCWETQFPEAGLNAAIFALYTQTYPTESARAEIKPPLLLTTVLAVRELFQHFAVPNSEVAARLAAMKMGAIWAEMEPHLPSSLLEGIPIRDPADTSPLLFF